MSHNKNHIRATVRRNNQSGFSLLFIIGVILALSTLASAMLSLSTSSVYTQLNTLAIAQARLVALSGYNYVLQFKEDYDELEGKTFKLNDDSQFTIGDNMRQHQDSDGNLWMDVEIIGTVHRGTSSEANYVLARSFQPEDQGAITFADNWEDFDDITPHDGLGKNPITKNDDKTFTIGNNEYYAFGAFYYMGSKKLNWGANECLVGECQFKYGFRLFFVSHYDTSDADGIVFTWFSTQTDETNAETSDTRGKSLHGTDCCAYETYRGQCDIDDDDGKDLSYNDYYDHDGNTHGYVYDDEDDSEYAWCKADMADATNTIYGSKYEACAKDENSADCDLYASVGGDSQHGEMIGYGGDGRYYKVFNDRTLYGWLDPERNGIQEPKMGIEFDNFWNNDVGICSSGTTANPVTGSRDDPGSRNSAAHLAYVFWGDDAPVDESVDDFDSILYPCALYYNYSSSQQCTQYETVCTRYENVCTGGYQYECTKYNNWGRCQKWEWVCQGWEQQCTQSYQNCTKYETVQNYEYYTVNTSSYGLASGTSNLTGSNTYDDNRHYRGENNTLTQNLDTGYGTSWANKTFAFRAEVERHYRYSTDDGTYEYILTSWLHNCTTSDCAEYWDSDYYDPDEDSDDLYFSDTSRFLCWDSNDTRCSDESIAANTPTLKKTIYLTEKQNEQLDTIMFGFTEATGGSTQKATYSQFILQFIKQNDYNYVVTDPGEDDYKIEILSRRRVHNRQIN